MINVCLILFHLLLHEYACEAERSYTIQILRPCMCNNGSFCIFIGRELCIIKTHFLLDGLAPSGGAVFENKNNARFARAGKAAVLYSL